MTEENKQLLIKDLCARLSYGLKFQSYHSECGIEGKGTFDFEIGDDATLSKLKHLCESGNNKPYLRPMSSMTEKEQHEYDNLRLDNLALSKVHLYYPMRWHTMDYLHVDWLNAHHFDYRGLIPKGLALVAPEGMYKKD